MKRIVLCADDYGQASSISEGILNLVSQKRLSASSCMVNTPDWPKHAAWIKPYQHQIDIGLHLNLTEGVALGKKFIDKYGKNLIPLKILLMRSLIRKLDPAAIEAECHAQIDRFIATLGFDPCFIDGHQHVHQFPIIRESLMKVYAERFKTKKPYMRLVGGKNFLQDFSFKKFIIQCTGEHVFRGLLNDYQIPHNQSFSGIYAFSKAYRYDQLFTVFVQKTADGGIIMCHPGLPGGRADKIAHVRGKEYAYLMGPAFLKVCNQQKVVLSRFG